MAMLLRAAAVLACCAVPALAAQDTVSVRLQAPWAETPPAMEASELFAQESPALFWRFLDAGAAAGSPERLREQVDALAAEWLPPLAHEVFRGQLLARSASPAVEAQLQVSRGRAGACGALFAEVNGDVVCEVPAAVDGLPAGTAPLYDNDHVHPLAAGVSPDAVPTVVLYGAVGSPEFHAAHAALVGAATAGKVRYAVRHHHAAEAPPLQLAGYGVELDVKKMDYVAKDDTKIAADGDGADGSASADQDEADDEWGGFDFKRLIELHAGKADKLAALREHVKSHLATVRELKVWELQDIDIQAASRIARSGNPAAALQDVCQNFPVLAPALVREAVNESLRAEAAFNAEKVLAPVGLDSGGSLLTVNSLIVSAETADLHTMLSTLRADAKLLNGLRSVGFPASVVPDVMSLTDTAAASQVPVLDFRHSTVQWVNDLERDARYRGFKWSANAVDLLRPAMPGAMRYIARNMWHAVFVVDPATPEGTAALALASELIEQDLPVRFGFLFTSGRAVGGGRRFEFSKEGYARGKKEDQTADEAAAEAAARAEAAGNKAAIQMMRVYSFIAEDGGTGDAFAFLLRLAKDGGRNVSTKKVKAEFVRLHGEGAWTELKTKAMRAKHDKLLKGSERAIASFGLDKLPHPVLLVNGESAQVKPDDLTAEVVTAVLARHMAEHTPTVQRGLYYGELPQAGDVLEYFMGMPGVVKRLNSRVTTLDGPVLDFAGAASPPATEPSNVAAASLAATAAASLRYLEFSSKAKAATFWVVADFGGEQGWSLAFDALRRQLFEKKSRVALVHNGAADSAVARALFAAADVLTSADAASGGGGTAAVMSVGKMLASALNGGSDLDTLLRFVPGGQQAAVRAAAEDTGRFAAVASLHAELCSRALRLAPGEAAVVVNGRVVGPLKHDETLTTEDYKILEKKMQRGVSGKMLTTLARNKELTADGDVIDAKRSDFVMAGTALLQQARSSSSAPPGRRLSTEYLAELKTEHVGIDVGMSGDALAAAPLYHDILLVVDPLSKAAQHAVPLVRYVASLVSARTRIVLNPREKVSEAPLNRFYRSVLPPATAAEAAKGKPPAAVFRKLPIAPLLTLGMHVPPAWLVQAAECPYDLDNIHLESAPHGVHAVFHLENILVEGRCYEDGTYQPTPGLQLQLGPVGGGGVAGAAADSAAPAVVDTLVMANLGYFQLKANPGVWELGIRPGRSLDIYDFKTVEDVEVVPDSHPSVVLNGFTGTNVYVTMQRRPGMERARLLSGAGADGDDDEAADGGLWGRLSDLVSAKKASAGSGQGAGDAEVAASGGRSGETINVFSLASGHLYERFLKIMMLSVLKNTNNPVKFWFLKNCMSPQLQSFLPDFAREYGFSYELVQYKWPSWLNMPPTKHRQIWGYKILFLDTLFPLDVNKIIFVDADQVVRADLKELLEIDLEGAPYGYTPFCSDRTEMDGFRFWNSGYWKEHLNGKPYHISALYVVDLIRFRQLAAGDRLREQYQGLSRDPNSLSNLDQDLPNNMVHQVPIKSLPQEWLWCETWCSDEIKPRAKTIDLCNNPLTKEPKLEAAVRIVSEWQELDAEARNVTNHFERSAAADAGGDGGGKGVKDEL